MMLWIEIITAAVIALIVFVTSLFQLKGDHLGGEALQVRFGALLQGLLFGGTIAFVMLPLRLAVMEGGPGMTSPAGFGAWLPALAMIYIVRSGIIARLPLIGRPFRAYRLASLRQSISVAQARITRLEALNRRKEVKA